MVVKVSYGECQKAIQSGISVKKQVFVGWVLGQMLIWNCF